jgi:hypothetical protein
MGAHAHYPQHSAPTSGVRLSTLVRFALWVAILAAAVWFIGTVVGEDVATIVTGWFRNL